MPDKLKGKERGKVLRAKAEATRAELVKRFPLCFVPQGSTMPKPPLKVGIRRDVFVRAPDLRGSIGLALADYCRGRRYGDGLYEGAVRIDLDGSPAGTVTASHAAHQARLNAKQEASWAKHAAAHQAAA